MEAYKLFIDNTWVDAGSDEILEVLSPTDESVVGAVQMGTAEDADKALASAERAQKAWGDLPAQSRAEYLLKLADALLDEKERLAELLTKEQGKLYATAIGEVEGTAGFIAYAAESARRMEGELLNSDFTNEQVMIQRIPYGVTVGLLTWNFPLALAGRKLGNALVSGNTMVLMPPLHAPLTVYELGKIAADILPKGVMNIITGPGSVVGDRLVRSPLTKMVSLTGSTSIGRMIAKAAADNLTVLSLELGGKSPFIVMDDADVIKAAHAAVESGYGNCGQICTSNERMYIHEKVYDEFMTYFVEEVKALKVGDPMDETSDIGPKMNPHELEKCRSMVERAAQEGATVLAGGKVLKDGAFSKGYWFQPTIITDVTNDMEIMQEETFGPIVTATKVDSFETALALANDCDYGLSGYLFTNNMKHIMTASQKLEVGEIYINRRNAELLNGFHAGTKLSGIGGEDGKHGLELYSQKKTVYVNYDL